MFVVVAALLLTLVGEGLAQCTAEYEAISGHTNCLTDSPDVDASQSGITDQDKIDIVNKHNEYRGNLVVNDINGGDLVPRDLMKLQWDDKLQTSAQKWANQCPTGHDTSSQRSEPTYPTFIGQNMAWSQGDKDLSIALAGWYSEIQYFVYNVNTSAQGVVGHFTQVVHNKMTRVGCGFALCPSVSYKAITVCNYDNTNMIQQYYTPFSSDSNTANRAADCNAADRENGLCAGACMSLWCLHGGSINMPTCQCSCQSGWIGDQCQTKDCTGLTDSSSNGCPTWSSNPDMWNDAGYKPFFLGSCTLSMCENPPTYMQ